MHAKKDTWETLKYATAIRNHILASTLINETAEIPNNLYYHRKCYQRFTLKRDIEKLKAEQYKIDKIIGTPIRDGSDETRKSKRKAGSSTILPKECLFCKK